MDDAALERHFLEGLPHPRRQLKMCAEAEVEISRLHDATQKFHIVAEAQPPIHETSKMEEDGSIHALENADQKENCTQEGISCSFPCSPNDISLQAHPQGILQMETLCNPIMEKDM